MFRNGGGSTVVLNPVGTTLVRALFTSALSLEVDTYIYVICMSLQRNYQYHIYQSGNARLMT